MARVQMYGNKLVNAAAAHHMDTAVALRRAAREVEGRARGNLASARSSTPWEKIHGPDHLTSVGSGRYDVDHYVFLEAPNPMAIEFGHAPSGVFGPDGELGHLETKAPHGLYILTRAAGLGRVAGLSSGRKRGKSIYKNNGSNFYTKARKRKKRKRRY